MKYICYLFIVVNCLVFTSCHSQETKTEQVNILLQLYPTGVIEDIRYSIRVSNDSLIVENHSPRNTGDKTYYEKVLTKEQLTHIDGIISNITERIIKKQPSVVDTWGATLTINGTIYYEVDDFSFEKTPSQIKDLLDYIVSLSPLKNRFVWVFLKVVTQS